MDRETAAGTSVEDIPFVPERGFYQPSSDETWEAYQALITLVEYHCQIHLPHAVICGVADEVLSVLKNINFRTLQEKAAEIEKILNPFPPFLFEQLVSIGERITDYYAVGGASQTDDRGVLFAHEQEFYQPKSEGTSTVYKMLLDLLNNQLGSQLPQTVQCVLAHEVLVVLKNPEIEYTRKMQMLQNTLYTISDDNFDTMLSLAELINDFDDNENNAPSAADLARNSVDPSDATATDDDEYVNPKTGIKFVHSSDDEQTDLNTADDKVVGSTEEENPNCGEETDPNSEDSVVYNSDRESMPIAEASALFSGIKLEYSSEEEIIHLDSDKLQDVEDEDGWVIFN